MILQMRSFQSDQVNRVKVWAFWKNEVSFYLIGSNIKKTTIKFFEKYYKKAKRPNSELF
jgi:hypothetical protein